MRGRKPKPTVLRILEGNRGKRPLNGREPQPAVGIPATPSYLKGEALAEWNRITPLLVDMKLLTVVDGAALAMYCVSYARWLEAERHVQQHGMVIEINGRPRVSPHLAVAHEAAEQMRKLMVEFGMTPSSRARIKLPTDVQRMTEFEKFLNDEGA